MSRARLVALAAILVATVVGFRVLASVLTPSDAAWTRVERRDLVVQVPIEGELESVESARLGPPALSNTWNFKISFLAPEGSEVQPGQPVLGFDTTSLRQRLGPLTAERDAAAKELEKKETDLLIERRAISLELSEARARARRALLKLEVPDDVAARNELEQARIDAALADLEIASIERRLANLERQGAAERLGLRQTRDRRAREVREIEEAIDKMTVMAPSRGTVIYRSQNREKPKIGDTVWRARHVIEIPDLDHLAGDGWVAEADVGRIAVGQQVSIRLDAYPAEVHHATVAEIRRTVQRRSLSDPKRIVKVALALEKTDAERMRPGMRFRGHIEIDRRDDALVIPADAVFSDAGGMVVFRRTWLGREVAHPTLGVRGDQGFEVTDGLRVGEWVLRRPERTGEGGGS